MPTPSPGLFFSFSTAFSKPGIFTIKEALVNIRRSVMMTVVSILTITISLVMMGVFGIITLNIVLTIKSMREKVDMEVYLKDGLGDVVCVLKSGLIRFKLK